MYVIARWVVPWFNFGQTVGLCFWKRRQVVELSHTPAGLKIEEPAIPKRAMANQPTNDYKTP